MAQITLWGMYQYQNSLFDNLSLPVDMDKNVFLELLFNECGGLYPYHQVPDRLQANIGYWCQSRLADWNRMWAAMTAEYSPIENYDRYEDRDWQDRGTDTTTWSGSDKLVNTGGAKDTTTPSLVTNQRLDVAAYDSSTFQPRENTVIEQTGSSAVDNSHNDDTTTTYGKVDTKEYGKGNKEYAHIHGNIGVTTNQQMIEAEMGLRMRYNMYYIIIHQFEDKFLVQIY